MDNLSHASMEAGASHNRPRPQLVTKTTELELILGSAKSAVRPVAFTRESNDFISTVTNVGPPQEILLAQISQQKSQRKIMTLSYPPKNKYRIISACMYALSCGFSDAAPGALLPTIEKHYTISYSVVSLIWMSTAAGFILVATLSHQINKWFGKERAVMLGCLFLVLMYLIVASGGPFPLIVVGFFLGGVGFAITFSRTTVFLNKLDKSSKYLSFFHGGYGLGATISPFLATTMIEHNVKWNYVYLILMGLMMANVVSMGLSFRGADEDLKQWEYDEETEMLVAQETPTLTQVNSRTDPSDTETDIGLQEMGTHITAILENKKGQKPQADDSDVMALALRNKNTWLISFFLFFYQGCEVALGGWIVSYLVDYRHTTTSYGYVLSGFWGGLTLGRLLLTRVLHVYVGARRSIIGLVFLTLLTISLTWAIPHDILLSIFVSMAGVFIGPICPLMITVVGHLFPKKIEVVSITIMTAFGSSGGAVLPFLVGIISQQTGTFVVLPICLAGFLVMLGIWYTLPDMDRRGEPPKGKMKRILHLIW